MQTDPNSPLSAAEESATLAPPVPASAVQRERQELMLAQEITRGGIFSTGAVYSLARRMASDLANAGMGLPQDYMASYLDKRGQLVQNPHAASNCLIALELASRLGVSVLMVMQNVDMVHGRPGLRGAFTLALLNASGRFGPPVFEWRGKKGDKDWGCRLVMTRRADSYVCEGTWIDWSMVVAEGWDKNAKWHSIPSQMFPYRAASFFARQWAPDVTMGLHSAEEEEDVALKDVTPTRARASDLNAALATVEEPAAAAAAEPEAPGNASAAASPTPDKPEKPKRTRATRAAAAAPQPEPDAQPAADEPPFDPDPAPAPAPAEPAPPPPPVAAAPGFSLE